MSEFSVMTMDQIEAVAAKHSCSVVVAKDNELQFDLDELGDKRKLTDFVNDHLSQKYEVISTEFWDSKSGNRHAVVTLKSELPTCERIALQAMGGSDPIREFAALQCHKAGSPHPILLFKPLLNRWTEATHVA